MGGWGVGLAGLAAVAALTFAAAGCGGGAAGTGHRAADSHPALWYDEGLFARAVHAAETLPPAEGEVAGAVVPHDWLGGQYIAWAFRALAAGDAPDTVILIGPNHDNEGSAWALTSDVAWATPFGVVEPDRERIAALEDGGVVAIEPGVLPTEHSVAGLMPAIAYYLPEARVVPVILKGTTTPDEASRLAQALAAQAGGDAVIVAAVDFSHDLTAEEAARNNAVTLDALRAGDAGRLYALDNRYLDSPPSLTELARAMEALGAGGFTLTADTSSAALRGDALAPTTSYIVGYYRLDGAGSEVSER